MPLSLHGQACVRIDDVGGVDADVDEAKVYKWRAKEMLLAGFEPAILVNNI